MSHYATIKAIIDQVVTTNGQQEITGALLNEVLKAMVDSLGSDYQYGGVVVPSSNVGTPDQNVFYIAIKGGTYTNFGNVVIPNGITIFQWNGSWSNQILFAGDGGIFDITAFHNNTKYADLVAALGTNGANVPQSLRKGGMSVKFVQSSDNKYVQYRYMSSSTAVADFTNVANWQGIDNEPLPDSKNVVESGGVYKMITLIDSLTKSIYQKSGFNVADLFGNVILEVKNGHIFTKNFSSYLDIATKESDESTFDLVDVLGNVLLRINGGHIQTKNFNSRTCLDASQWLGKNWFAYGTSLTAKQTQYPKRGVYAEYVASNLSLLLTNRGSGGSGMTTASDQAIYNRIMTLDDGKADADLITLECGANDQNAPLGNLSDHSNNSTICGALNLILNYLQTNTHARIIVMSSWPFRYHNEGGQNVVKYPWDTYGSDNHTWYEMAKMIEKVANQNGVEYIPLMEECGMGEQARMNADTQNKFMVDQIHPTDLGAYNVAQYLTDKFINTVNWYNNK